MKIRRLDTTHSADVKKFKQFPFDLYRNSPRWVPPLASELNLVMDRQRHPFYQHSEGDFFIAESEGQVLGRIAALKNNNYCQFHQSQIAFFYYFESVEDAEVSNALFDAAVQWAREHNAQRVLGPKGFLRSNAVGLLAEQGFDELPALGMLYNPPYYDQLVKGYGFEKDTDHLSGYMDAGHHLPERMHEAAEKIRQRGEFWVKSFTNRSEMRQWIPVVEKVHDEAFSRNLGYYPTTPAEFKLMIENFITAADPRLPKLIMKGDEVAGFILAYANLSPALQKCRGQIWPLGWWYILQEQRRNRIIDLNGVGLLPRFQGMGGNVLLYVELEKTLQQMNPERVEIVQVDERNFKSKSDMETMGVTWYKRHRSYHLDL